MTECSVLNIQLYSCFRYNCIIIVFEVPFPVSDA